MEWRERCNRRRVGHLTLMAPVVLDFDFVYSLFRLVEEKAGIPASRCCETETIAIIILESYARSVLPDLALFDNDNFLWHSLLIAFQVQHNLHFKLPGSSAYPPSPGHLLPPNLSRSHFPSS